jgi:hypothetical protein
VAHKKNEVVVPSVEINPSQIAFTVPQAAVLTGLTPWRIRMAVWAGKLPAKQSGKTIIILRADAEAFLKNLPEVSVNDAAWLAKRQPVAR